MTDYHNKKMGGSKSTPAHKLKGKKVRFLKSPIRYKLAYHIEDVATIFDENLANILIKEGYAELCK